MTSSPVSGVERVGTSELRARDTDRISKRTSSIEKINLHHLFPFTVEILSDLPPTTDNVYTYVVDKVSSTHRRVGVTVRPSS